MEVALAHLCHMGAHIRMRRIIFTSSHAKTRSDPKYSLTHLVYSRVHVYTINQFLNRTLYS